MLNAVIRGGQVSIVGREGSQIRGRNRRLFCQHLPQHRVEQPQSEGRHMGDELHVLDDRPDRDRASA
jgi:hypothetical protein